MASDGDVKLTIKWKNGEVLNIVKPCKGPNNSVDLNVLRNSLLSLQRETNDILTKEVEAEKSAATADNHNNTTQGSEEEDEVEDDDEDEEENGQLNGPPEKRHKT